MIKTLHIQIYKKGHVVHVATIRSDWKDSNYTDLAERFDGCSMRSKSQTCPIWLIGKADHYTNFNHLKKFVS